jgi:hypothetical protein
LSWLSHFGLVAFESIAAQGRRYAVDVRHAGGLA